MKKKFNNYQLEKEYKDEHRTKQKAPKDNVKLNNFNQELKKGKCLC